MRLHSLAFSGYRTFAARSPSAPSRPLQHLQLAPLTILLGKNNSGKSTVARALHHVLLALASDGNDPFPMSGLGRSYGARFRDIQHDGNFFNPLDLELEVSSEDGSRAKLQAQLIQTNDSADDQPPSFQTLSFMGEAINVEELPIRGLFPDIPSADYWRKGALRLLKASCHLGPMRDSVQHSYAVRDIPSTQLPDSNRSVAQLLLADPTLRAEVEKWMELNLEGWRVDIMRNLDMFSLLARRSGRETNLADSGQGIQQVLPVVTLCKWRSLGRGDSAFIDIIEQPELHLHDAAHAPLGDLLLSAISNSQGSMVVETHSEALVLRIRRRIAEGLSPDLVRILYVADSTDGSQLRPIQLRSNGEVDWWPEGVFSEAFVEVKAIRRAQRARE